MKKIAIIYLPNGNELKFSTKDLGGNEYMVVDHISFSIEHQSITVKYREDDGKTVETWCGIPFHIESWE